MERMTPVQVSLGSSSVLLEERPPKNTFVQAPGYVSKRRQRMENKASPRPPPAIPVQMKLERPPQMTSSLSGNMNGHLVCTSKQYCLHGIVFLQLNCVTSKYWEQSQALQTIWKETREESAIWRECYSYISCSGKAGLGGHALFSHRSGDNSEGAWFTHWQSLRGINATTSICSES